MLEMAHPLIHSLVHLLCSPIHLLTTARFDRALISTALIHLLARSFAPELMGQWNIFDQFSKFPESLCDEEKPETVLWLKGLRRANK